LTGIDVPAFTVLTTGGLSTGWKKPVKVNGLRFAPDQALAADVSTRTRMSPSTVRDRSTMQGSGAIGATAVQLPTATPLRSIWTVSSSTPAARARSLSNVKASSSGFAAVPAGALIWTSSPKLV
jgi:hypothetical protein